MTDEDGFKAWTESDPLWGAFTDADEKEIARDAWRAALAWLRSQGEPVAEVVDDLKVGKRVIFHSMKALYETPFHTKLYAAPQLAIPAGWKLVPVEPTPEMCAEGMKGEGCTIKDGKRFAHALYSVMLAAAPEPTK